MAARRKSVRRQSIPRKPRPPRRRRARFSLWPNARRRRYWWRRFRVAPGALQAALALGAIALLWFAVNGVYQVARKPAELFFPVSGALYKTPAETWARYAPIFRAHATPTLTPEFLAALAQIESTGNPVARTYWRWAFAWSPFEWYRPASSAVGMYQITDGTFEAARRLCIHDHAVVLDGPWHDWRSCWFNALYARVLPSHATEMTAAYLDRAVAEIIARRRLTWATAQQRQDLAAIIHLCGATAGDAHAARGLRLRAGQRCGDHSVAAYLGQLRAAQRQFIALGAGNK